MTTTYSVQSVQALDDAAAEAGDPEALYELGRRYAYGVDRRINLQRAVDLWMAAAFQGHAEALYSLGHCYALGNAVPQDIPAAIDLWFRAASDGCTEAMYTLGLCHYHGDGVAPNVPQAVMWLLLASSHAHREAGLLLKTLSDSLSVDDRSEGLRLLDLWLKRKKTGFTLASGARAGQAHRAASHVGSAQEVVRDAAL